MRLEPIDLLGLAAGFAAGAVGLVVLSLWNGQSPPAPAPPPAAVAKAPARAPAAAPESLPKVWTPPRPSKRPEMIAMPPAAAPAQPQVTTLPNVIRPDGPAGQAVASGTGFFVTDDGVLLTAAHVVAGCKDLRLVSPFIPATAAEIVATDRTRDMAILRARRLRPPATLALGPPRTRREPARFLGYPADGDPRVASTAVGEVRNDAAPELIGRGVDPSDQVWLRGHAVRAGFSGGPVIGRDGQVMGLVFGRLTFDRQPGERASVVAGPGAGALAAFVRSTTGDVLAATGAENDDGAVRRAVVHVLCSR